MKIRNGFVSNSSSSSFVLFTSVENYQKVYATLNSLEKKIIKYITFSGGKFQGTKLKKLTYITGNVNTFEDAIRLTQQDYDIILDYMNDGVSKEQQMSKDEVQDIENNAGAFIDYCVCVVDKFVKKLKSSQIITHTESF